MTSGPCFNPYLLDLPAVVSFSGGRTSGFMLRHILDAHGGQPEGLMVCFQNTGLEHPATYDFVREVTQRWDVRIAWLEYCLTGEREHDVREVSYETASRDGEPFSALIDKKGYLPNPVARICTTNLKIRALYRFLKRIPEFAEAGWLNAIGLRYDEPRRVARMKSDNALEETCCPMYEARHTLDDVLSFWKGQPFDLHLPLTGNMAGNCVGCFLKSTAKLEILIEEEPEHFRWWVEAENAAANTASTPAGAVFRTDRPNYSGMLKRVAAQERLPFGGESIPCMCHD